MYSIHLSIYLSLTWEGICLFDFFFTMRYFFVIFCLIHCYKLFLFLHLKQINFWYSKIITFLKYSFWDLKFFFFICAIHRKINCWYLQNTRSCKVHRGLVLTSEQKNDGPCEKSLCCEKIDNKKKDLSRQWPIEFENLASIIFSIMFRSFEINRYYEWFEYQIIKPDVLIKEER